MPRTPLPHRSTNPLSDPLPSSLLVEASAGTGKTYAIAAIYCRLVVERRFSVDRILVVTFTRAATRELNRRIRSFLADCLAAAREPARVPENAFVASMRDRGALNADHVSILRRALADFDRAAILTIHGFCRKLLSENALLTHSPFETETSEEERDLLRRAVSDFTREHLAGLPRRFAPLCRDHLGPEALENIANLRRNHPLTPLLPRETLCLDDALEKRVLRAKAKTLSDWKRQGEEFARELATSTSLNRRSYAPDMVRKRLTVLAGYLEGDALRPGKETRTAVRKLGRTALEAGCRKKCSFPPFDVARSLDHLEEALAALDEEDGRNLVALRRLAAEEIPRRLEDLMASRGLRSFSDLLVHTHRAITGPDSTLLVNALRQAFSALLIDEFQDTDPLQTEIFTRIFDPSGTDRCLILVGDPKQAVYAFRGADIHAYLDAARLIPERAPLHRNYRSSSGAVGAVNTLFSATPDPFLHRDILFTPADWPDHAQRMGLYVDGVLQPGMSIDVSGLEGRTADNDSTNADRTADRIRDLAALGRAGRAELVLDGVTGARIPLSPAHMAVLVRTNDQAEAMRRALEARFVPCSLLASRSVFSSPTARDLLVLLTALISPADAGLVRNALATPFFNRTAAELDTLAEDQSVTADAQERFSRLLRVWRTNGFMAMFRRLLQTARILPRLLARTGGERSATDLLHLAELLHEAETRDLSAPEALTARLDDLINDPRDMGDEQQLRLESDRRCLTILTIHKSKGLQFPLVFCPDLSFSASLPRTPCVVHDPGSGAAVLRLDSELPEHLAEAALREVSAENRRLLYVALTRAQVSTHVDAGEAGRGNPVLASLIGLSGARDENSGNAFLERLRGLQKNSCGTIALVSYADPAPGAEICPGAHPATELHFREFTASIDRTHRLSSFSFITAHREPAFLDARENDLPPGERFTQAALSADDHPSAPTIHDFPSGPKPGAFFHALLEQPAVLFPGAAGSENLVRSTLSAFGYPPDWTPCLDAWLRDLRVAPLNRDGLCLAGIDPRCMVHEMEFHLPLRTITPAHLAASFARAAETTWEKRIASAVAGLDFPEHQGILRGFIDAVFEHRDRFYLLDWKSNRLGDSAAAYAPSAVEHSMLDSVYVLQYLLYSMALRRLLALRLPERDPSCFGGVFYLYLRGMVPDASPAAADNPFSTPPCPGVFFDPVRTEYLLALERELLL